MGIGFSEAIDLTSRVAELIKKGATLEAQEQIVALREAVLSGKEELLRLREEIQELRQNARAREDWNARVARYELVGTQGGAIVHRFTGTPEHFACPACFENRKIQILQDRDNAAGTFECPSCEAHYAIKRSQFQGSARAITDRDGDY